MKRILIKEVNKLAGKKIKVAGWTQVIRDQGGIKFILLRDISGTIQAIVTSDKPKLVKVVENLSIESVIKMEGKVKEERQAPGGVEIVVEKIKVLSQAAPELPIPVVVKAQKETAQNKRLDWRWIDLRKPKKALIFKIWTEMEQAFRGYCIANGYIEIHSPKIVVTSTESGSELFEINYFDRKAYLAQSPQLYKQMAQAAGFEKVFEVGPVFRANPSFTSRHDTEFTMYDVEFSFIDSHHDLMEEGERIMVAIFSAVKKKYGKQIKEVYGQDIIVPKIPFPKLTLKEAKEITASLGIVSEKDGDLKPEEERAVSKYVKDKKGHEFVFIHEYPASDRAFYSMRLESDPKLTKSFDLLYKGLEITSGAQREHRHDRLKMQIKEKGLKAKPFESYLNFFKYGCPPHGGFAPGPTRILMRMLDIANVREVTYLYRGVNRLTP